MLVKLTSKSFGRSLVVETNRKLALTFSNLQECRSQKRKVCVFITIFLVELCTLWTLFDKRSLLSDQGGLFIEK